MRALEALKVSPAWQPDVQHMTLLKACLLEGPEAVESWLSWRSSLDQLGDADLECLKLFPLLCDSVGSAISADEQAILKGCQRRVWSENQILFSFAKQILSELIANNIPVMMLKGASLVVQGVYPSLKLRCLGDVDLMVPPREINRVAAILEEGGWSIPEGWDGGDGTQRMIKKLHAFPTVSARLTQLMPTRSIDIHWRLSMLLDEEVSNREFWHRAVEERVNGLPVRMLCPEDQLLHLCLHGARAWESIAAPTEKKDSIIWIVDCVRLARAFPDLDWRETVDNAYRRGVSLQILSALQLLKKNFLPSIPDQVFDQSACNKVSRMEELVLFSTTSPRPDDGRAIPLKQSFYREVFKRRGSVSLNRVDGLDLWREAISYSAMAVWNWGRMIAKRVADLVFPNLIMRIHAERRAQALQKWSVAKRSLNESRVEPLFHATPLTSVDSFTAGIEGPNCDADGNIYAVNYLENGTVGKVTPDGRAEVFVRLEPGSIPNGIVFDQNGFMYVADYKKHNVFKIEMSSRRIVCHAHEPRMNQPNDLAITADGIIFASDPNWREKTGRVWRISVDGTIALLADDMGTTNGIEVSPDGKMLYVNESVQRRIWRFDITESGITNKTLFKKFARGSLDGMRCDVEGNLYVTRYGTGRVAVLSSSGDTVREIDVLGRRPSNLCFGGPDGKTLYVTEVDYRRLVEVRVDKVGLAWHRFRQSASEVL